MTNEELRQAHATKFDLAQEIYAGTTFDTAIPYSFQKRLYDLGYDDAASHFVWIYPEKDLMGKPGPLSIRGVEILSELAMRV